MGLRKDDSGFVRIDKKVIKKVKAKIKGTRDSIGSFFEQAAEEKLNKKAK